MSRMRRWLDRIEPLFTKGGPYHRYLVVYEMVDTFLYTPADVTRTAPHVRDGIDLKRLMFYVVIAALPCVAMALWNTGYQAHLAMQAMGTETVPGWRGFVLGVVGAGHSPASLWDNLWHGALYFLPIYAVTVAVGGLWELLFAWVRNHEVNEGFLVTSMLYTLILPATTPLWQVALGISFGVVIGKEVFGGTGKNFLNPALTGRAFLYFAYPAQMSGDAIWTTVDGFTGATALAAVWTPADGLSGASAQGVSATAAVDALAAIGITWMDAFLGLMQGSLGETSTLACLLGAVFLLYTRIASYRIVLGVFIGMVVTSLLFNLIGSSTNPMFAMPWYWHLVLGGFAFGMVFMATDPVSAAMTDTGRWIFGLLIGVMTVLIRVVNPAFPEGIMLAILFANLCAPLIDWGVVKLHIRRRARRLARRAT